MRYLAFVTLTLFTACSRFQSSSAPDDWGQTPIFFTSEYAEKIGAPNIFLPLPKNSDVSGNRGGVTIIEDQGIMFDILLSKFFDISLQESELGVWSCEQAPGKLWKNGKVFVNEILLKCSEELNIFYPGKIYKLTIDDASLYVVPAKKSTDEDLAKIRLSILNAEIK